MRKGGLKEEFICSYTAFLLAFSCFCQNSFAYSSHCNYSSPTQFFLLSHFFTAIFFFFFFLLSVTCHLHLSHSSLLLLSVLSSDAQSFAWLPSFSLITLSFPSPPHFRSSILLSPLSARCSSIFFFYPLSHSPLLMHSDLPPHRKYNVWQHCDETKQQMNETAEAMLIVTTSRGLALLI